MPAGRYRTPIAIERNQRTTEAGQRVDSWRSWLNRRGSVRAVSARENAQADVQNTVLISHTIRLRSDSQSRLITPGMRVRIEARKTPRQILHIESVIDIEERGIELELRCVERAVPQ